MAQGVGRAGGGPADERDDRELVVRAVDLELLGLAVSQRRVRGRDDRGARDHGLPGAEIEREKFAGEDISWSCEGVMRDGNALQMGTSHELGQNFARAFDTRLPIATASCATYADLVGSLDPPAGRDDHGPRRRARSAAAATAAPVQVVVLFARAGGGVIETATTLATELDRGQGTCRARRPG